MAGSDDPTQRDARLALAGAHPDVREIERSGARISAEQVADIIRNASLAPVEGSRKVMILHDFHLLDAAAAARLLKTLEEPPESTIFIVLADQVHTRAGHDRVQMCADAVRRAAHDVVSAQLVESGIDPETADVAAQAAEGNLTRARVLATDPGLMARRDAFAALATRLDGTGTTVVKLCTELLALIDAAAAPLAVASCAGTRRSGIAGRGDGRTRKWSQATRGSPQARAASSSRRRATQWARCARRRLSRRARPRPICRVRRRPSPP